MLTPVGPNPVGIRAFSPYSAHSPHDQQQSSNGGHPNQSASITSKVCYAPISQYPNVREWIRHIKTPVRAAVDDELVCYAATWGLETDRIKLGLKTREFGSFSEMTMFTVRSSG